MRIIFFGTSNVALPVLEALSRKHEVVLVVTSPDAPVGKKQVLTPSPVSVLAAELHIETLKPETVKNNPGLVAMLKEKQADVYIVVSYGKILPKEVITLPPHKTLNIHFSLLPKLRGASPIQHALLQGDKETGTTIFVLNERMDEGPIIAQKTEAIDPDDNFFTLSERMARVSAQLLLDTLPEYASGSMLPREQDHTKATYTKIITKADGKIDWHKTTDEIYNQFRAFYPWPGVWTMWQGQLLKIHDCAPTQGETTAPPGTVLEDGQVACGNGTILKLFQLQLAGKNQANISSFLNGYQNFPGSLLE